jgi:hypothetical protein
MRKKPGSVPANTASRTRRQHPSSRATIKVGMSKKYKGKLCAYCTNKAAEAGDHVFSREFFLVEDRDDLPQAPILRFLQQREIQTGTLPDGGASIYRKQHHKTQWRCCGGARFLKHAVATPIHREHRMNATFL